MLHEIAFNLYLVGKINPQAQDAINPMGPVYSGGTRMVIAGQLIKATASAIKNKQLHKITYDIGKRIYSAGVATMSYEDDNFCGNGVFQLPIPIPPKSGPWGFDGDMNALNPQPQPPKYLSAVLEIVAEIIEDKALSTELAGVANKLKESK